MDHEQSMKKSSDIRGTVTPDTASTSSPDRTSDESSGIGICSSTCEEHEYLHFLLRITEDILRNDLYTNSGMDRVFESHIEANKHRLNEGKMREQVENLKKELNYPLLRQRQMESEGIEAMVCLCDPAKRELLDTLLNCDCCPAHPDPETKKPKGACKCDNETCPGHFQPKSEVELRMDFYDETKTTPSLNIPLTNVEVNEKENMCTCIPNEPSCGCKLDPICLCPTNIDDLATSGSKFEDETMPQKESSIKEFYRDLSGDREISGSANHLLETQKPSSVDELIEKISRKSSRSQEMKKSSTGSAKRGSLIEEGRQSSRELKTSSRGSKISTGSAKRDSVTEEIRKFSRELEGPPQGSRTGSVGSAQRDRLIEEATRSSRELEAPSRGSRANSAGSGKRVSLNENVRSSRELEVPSNGSRIGSTGKDIQESTSHESLSREIRSSLIEDVVEKDSRKSSLDHEIMNEDVLVTETSSSEVRDISDSQKLSHSQEVLLSEVRTSISRDQDEGNLMEEIGRQSSPEVRTSITDDNLLEATNQESSRDREVSSHSLRTSITRDQESSLREVRTSITKSEGNLEREATRQPSREIRTSVTGGSLTEQTNRKSSRSQEIPSNVMRASITEESARQTRSQDFPFSETKKGSTASTQEETIQKSSQQIISESESSKGKTTRSSIIKVVERQDTLERARVDDSNYKVKVIESDSINVVKEERISDVAKIEQQQPGEVVFYKDKPGGFPCECPIRKTALKLNLMDNQEDEYVLLEGPICLPRKIVESRATPVFIESVVVNGDDEERQTEIYVDESVPDIDEVIQSENNFTEPQVHEINRESDEAKLPEETKKKCECDFKSRHKHKPCKKKKKISTSRKESLTRKSAESKETAGIDVAALQPIQKQSVDAIPLQEEVIDKTLDQPSGKVSFLEDDVDMNNLSEQRIGKIPFQKEDKDKRQPARRISFQEDLNKIPLPGKDLEKKLSEQNVDVSSSREPTLENQALDIDLSTDQDLTDKQSEKSADVARRYHYLLRDATTNVSEEEIIEEDGKAVTSQNLLLTEDYRAASPQEEEHILLPKEEFPQSETLVFEITPAARDSILLPQPNTLDEMRVWDRLSETREGQASPHKLSSGIEDMLRDKAIENDLNVTPHSKPRSLNKSNLQFPLTSIRHDSKIAPSVEDERVLIITEANDPSLQTAEPEKPKETIVSPQRVVINREELKILENIPQVKATRSQEENVNKITGKLKDFRAFDEEDDSSKHPQYETKVDHLEVRKSMAASISESETERLKNLKNSNHKTGCCGLGQKKKKV